MSPQEVEQDLTERYFLFFARYHVGHVIHGDPNRVSEPILQRLGRARPGDNVLPRMNNQRRRFDLTEVRPNIVSPAGLDKAQVGLDTPL